jgi:hypothetical protein
MARIKDYDDANFASTRTHAVRMTDIYRQLGT